jgi:hypothetical protein
MTCHADMRLYDVCLSRFEVRLPDVFQYIHQSWSAIEGRIRAEQFKVIQRYRSINIYRVDSVLFFCSVV